MKTSEEVYESLKSNFENKINDTIQTGSVIDIYNKTIADECQDMYQYIEDNKNPYLFTNTFGDDLDSLGYWVNLTRLENETDEHYKYRLKDWLKSTICFQHPIRSLYIWFRYGYLLYYSFRI